MIPNLITVISIAMLSFSTQLASPLVSSHTLSSEQMSLNDRYPWVESVNSIFKDNILLNLAYMNGNVTSGKDINWNDVEKPQQYKFTLQPGQTFAFHGDVLPEYAGKVVKTTNAHFNGEEGFKSDGYLYGDGVCHLASLIYWAAKDANLDTLAPTNHNFMPIPEIDRQYGVAIYDNPYAKGSGQRENLYITNNKDKPIEFDFDYNGDILSVSAVEIN